jgi:DNA-directed RNA polymerase specialized sigma24 family protein
MATEGSSEKLLRAAVALLADERESRLADREPLRTEVLLARAGLTNNEIADLTGKSPANVRVILSRARKATKGEP